MRRRRQTESRVEVMREGQEGYLKNEKYQRGSKGMKDRMRRSEAPCEHHGRGVERGRCWEEMEEVALSSPHPDAPS